MKSIFYFFAIISILLFSCTKNSDGDSIKCKNDPEFGFVKFWSSELMPYFNYSNTQWFDLKDHIAIISDVEGYMQIIEKSTGNIISNSIIGNPLSISNIHFFNNRVYFLQKLKGVIEHDPYNDELNVIIENKNIRNIKAYKNLLVASYDDEANKTVRMILIDLGNGDLSELESIAYNTDMDRMDLNPRLIYEGPEGDPYLYYSRTGLFLQENDFSSVRINLTTFEKTELNKPAIGSLRTYKNGIYSISIGATEVEFRKFDPVSFNEISRIVPGENYSSLFYKNFFLQDDEVVFYGNAGACAYKLDNGSLSWSREDFLSDDEFNFAQLTRVNDKLFLNYTRVPVYGYFSFTEKTKVEIYCDVPAALNNQSSFVAEGELFIINFGKTMQKYRVGDRL